jgi:alanyl-tRNA synthetase
VGARVKLEIDWARRYQLMKAHSVTHLLNATLKKVLGFHVRQMGAQKGTDSTRFDIAHYRNIEPDQVAEIEGRVNEAIFGGAPISTEVMRRGAAEDKYGFFIYQGGFVPFDELRIVTIAGIDTEACAGTHLKDIQEVSLFKMLGASQIQNNVYRLRYTVSGEALGQFHEAEKILHQVQETLGTARDVTASKIVKLFDEVKDQSKLLGDYEETILRLESQAARAQEAGKPALYFFKSAVPKDRAMRHLIRMARTGENQVYFTVFKDGALMMRSKDLKNLDLAAAAAKFDKLEILNSGNDMIVFGGQVEPGAAWDIARKLV